MVPLNLKVQQSESYLLSALNWLQVNQACEGLKYISYILLRSPLLGKKLNRITQGVDEPKSIK
jgi:hypothetical protein